MRAKEFITEALKPSEYRQFVKNWDSSRYEDIFRSDDWKTDRRAFRIYLPLEKSDKAVDNIPVEIQNAVSEKGYEIEDYKKGIAKQKDGKRQIKIGKLLPPDLIQKFANDPDRQAQDEYVVVISRHPYDIAGMSTGRGWTSCLNLTGCNSRYVPVEVKEGTIVAYLAKTDDPDLKSPIGRIAIKPFVEIKTKEVFFGVDNRVYGTNVPGFKETVKDWADKINELKQTNDMLLAVPSDKLYFDDETPPNILLYKDADQKELAKAVAKNPKLIKSMYSWFDKKKGPSKDLQLVAIGSDPYAIQYIKNPSEEMQLRAVSMNPWVLRYIKNPTDKVYEKAIRLNPNLFFNVPTERASEELQVHVVSILYSTIRDIKNPSERVQLAAVNNDPDAINYIKNPTDKVKKLAQQLSNKRD